MAEEGAQASEGGTGTPSLQGELSSFEQLGHTHVAQWT